MEVKTLVEKNETQVEEPYEILSTGFDHYIVYPERKEGWSIGFFDVVDYLINAGNYVGANWLPMCIEHLKERNA